MINELEWFGSGLVIGAFANGISKIAGIIMVVVGGLCCLGGIIL